MRVLLIEPDRLLAQNAVLALKRAGHVVDWQVDAQEAIAAADKKTPDVLVTDVFLANRTGIEFLYEFRSYPDWSRVPAIIFGSLPQEEARVYLDALDKLDVKHFFYKPNTSLAQLVEAVNQLAVPANEAR